MHSEAQKAKGKIIAALESKGGVNFANCHKLANTLSSGRYGKHHIERTKQLINGIKGCENIYDIQDMISSELSAVKNLQSHNAGAFFALLQATLNLAGEGLLNILYDHRGNNIGATINESTWALSLLKSANITLVKKFLISFNKFVGPGEFPGEIKTSEETALVLCHNYFSKAALEATVNSKASCSGVVKNRYYGLRNHLYLSSNRDGSRSLGGGRGEATKAYRRRADSYQNRDAGIVDQAHMPLILRDVLHTTTSHAKNMFQRNPLITEKDFASFCQKRDIPFLSGASGTVAFLLTALPLWEGDQVSGGPALFSNKNELEKFLVIHIALEIALGHHSLFELTIPYEIAQSQYNSPISGWTPNSKVFEDDDFGISSSTAEKSTYNALLGKFNAILKRLSLPEVKTVST